MRVGGGYEPLKNYVEKNGRHFKRVIVTHMNKSGKDYEDVVDNMVSGKKKFGDISDS